MKHKTVTKSRKIKDIKEEVGRIYKKITRDY